MHQVGIVIIGRNEGERLRRCVTAVVASKAVIVYVDSGSSDGSIDLARALGAEVVQLSMDRPFSAARARNTGFGRLLELAPNTQYVQFIDGDCELEGHWIDRAVTYLNENPSVAFVCGHLNERFPEVSFYNRLCQIEWNGSTGEITSCGGIFMARREALDKAGVFNESIVAGEERELGYRIRAAGWRICRLDIPMGWHDAAMLYFRQWWRRQVRGGYGSLDVARQFNVPQFRRQVLRCRFWTLGWIFFCIIAIYCGIRFGSITGLVAGIFLSLLVLLSQITRVAIRQRSASLSFHERFLFGVLSMASQWAQLQGHVKYYWDRTFYSRLQLIEYKQC